MEKINQLVEIVYDNKKRKLRARNIQDGRWCSFPNKLRVKNKVFKAAKITKGRGDSWRASKPTEFHLTEKNEEIENILNLKNKAVKKEFYSNIIKRNEEIPKINTEMLNIIFLVKSIFPDIDEQILQPLIKQYNHSAFLQEDHLVDIQNLLINYNEKRVVSLFANYSESDYLEDTIIMYKRLFENDIMINDILPKKPKNIRELHDIFMRECKKIKTPNIGLKQDKIDYLEGLEVKGLKFMIPKTAHDLIDIGNKLSICVGNGYYAEKILNKRSNIIALTSSSGKYLYCIEFSNNCIIQAKGLRNSNLDNESCNIVAQILFQKDKKVA